jgi:hypothetical protein
MVSLNLPLTSAVGSGKEASERGAVNGGELGVDFGWAYEGRRKSTNINRIVHPHFIDDPQTAPTKSNVKPGFSHGAFYLSDLIKYIVYPLG